MSKQLRFVCPQCGEAMNLDGNGKCYKCGEIIENPNEGMVQIYRMGAFIGFAVGYGIYIDKKPYGHIGNQESIRIPLKYGTYTFHFTCGMTRKCEDITITLSPENPNTYMKVSIKAGFWSNTIKTKLVTKEEMPEL